MVWDVLNLKDKLVIQIRVTSFWSCASFLSRFISKGDEISKVEVYAINNITVLTLNSICIKFFNIVNELKYTFVLSIQMWLAYFFVSGENIGKMVSTKWNTVPNIKRQNFHFWSNAACNTDFLLLPKN